MQLSQGYDWVVRHPTAMDALGAGVLWLLLGLTSFTISTTHGVLATLSFAALALRRQRPTLTFTLTCLLCLVQVALGATMGPHNVSFLVALYALASYGDVALWRRAGLAVGWLGAFIGSFVYETGAPYTWAESLFITTMIGALGTATWVAGDLMRHRRHMLARVDQQNQALLRDQEQRERLAAQSERARIAREMHDVVAHNLSVIVVQADGAAYRAGLDPVAAAEQSAQTLETIAATARSALTETRRLVGVLRADGVATEYAPTETLADVDALVDRVRDSGLPVTLEHRGTPGPVDPEVGLAAYRIVQEALTNVIKHAGRGATAHVVVDHGPPVGIVVHDNGIGRGAAFTGDGHGLIGMRERVDAVGGSLQTGPERDGGFLVSAYLPGRAVG